MQNQHPAPPPKSTKKTTTPPQQDRPTRLIRLPEVKTRVGLSRSSIYMRISDGTFPAPVRLGEKSVAWLETDIDAWIQDRLTDKGVAA